MTRKMSMQWPAVLAVCGGLALTSPALAHPHVFVDGGVDFVIQDDGQLGALSVTWLYDEFETLYMLAALEIALPVDGVLSATDRETLTASLSLWSDDFDGSAHLLVDGTAPRLADPTDVTIAMQDGRLKVTYQRALITPIAVDGRDIEVGFYESTYFFAFSVTQPARLHNAPDTCATDVIAFEPDGKSAELQQALQMLSREETPDIANVGSFFADRITLTCA